MISKELQDTFTGKTRDRVVETLEIYHEDTNMEYFFCKYPSELDLTLEDGTIKNFKPSNFVVKLPPYEENGHLDITVAFASVGFSYIREIENIIKNHSSKIKFKYRLYLENKYKYPQTQAPFVFSVSAIDMSNRNVTFNGSLLMSIQTKIPKINYTVENFPGLKFL